MTRWLPILAAGCLVAVIAVVLATAVTPGAQPSPAERADALAAELRCPDCQGLSVADSPTGSAREIRRQIEKLLAAGATDVEVRDHFVARYGNWIRLAPGSSLVWVVPFVVVIAGVALLALWLRPSRPSGPAPSAAVDAEQRRRLREEVESLDA